MARVDAPPVRPREPPLLPAHLAADTIEALLAERSTRGHPVYLAVLALVAALLVSLPLVRVPVTVRSGGVVRPTVEKHQVRAGASGLLESVSVREGERVRRGAVIATLRREALESRATLLTQQRAEVEAALADLDGLAAERPTTDLLAYRPRSARYRQELEHLRNAHGEHALRLGQAERELDRARALLARDLVARAEVERMDAALAQERAAGEVLVQRARSAWQAARAEERARLRDLTGRETELQAERALSRVLAPVSGTIEQLASVSPGSYVQAGEPLGVISPGGSLVAEIHVSPREVGLLRPGTPVRMQVDAFDHRDWGFATGRIRGIPSDSELMDQRPIFRLRVALDQTHLSLPNGARGELRKGMTLQARFLLAERTLFQLLRDDVADWLDPSAARAGEPG